MVDGNAYMIVHFAKLEQQNVKSLTIRHSLPWPLFGHCSIGYGLSYSRWISAAREERWQVNMPLLSIHKPNQSPAIYSGKAKPFVFVWDTDVFIAPHDRINSPIGQSTPI
jgi:hypothetical protein